MRLSLAEARPTRRRQFGDKIADTPCGRKEGRDAAFPSADVPSFMEALRKQPGTAARALGSHFEPFLVQTSYSFMESLFDVDQQTYR